MSYALARSAFHMNKRSAPRRLVEIAARLCDASARFDVDVTDLSALGFRAESSFILRPGSRVWLMLPDFPGMEAVVAWRDRYQYGCAFTRPLHQTSVDHLAARDRT